jgi:hypothetical protein
MDHFLKIRITLGLCVVLGASFNSVRAADNPAQAAARAALEQKLSQSDAWEPQPQRQRIHHPRPWWNNPAKPQPI